MRENNPSGRRAGTGSRGGTGYGTGAGIGNKIETRTEAGAGTGNYLPQLSPHNPGILSEKIQ
jgi:hypothetical protein